MKHLKSDQRGFLILEILIAGLILTSSIAATMYLFRLGFEHLQRANDSNVISSKLPQAINLVKTIDMERKEGVEDMGDGVVLKWNATLMEKIRPVYETFEGTFQSVHELYLYRVDFSLEYKGIVREYEINAFRYKTAVSPSELIF